MTPDEVVEILKISIKVNGAFYKLQENAGIKFSEGRLKYRKDVEQAVNSAISLIQDYQKLRERIDVDEIRAISNKAMLMGLSQAQAIVTYLQQPTEH